MKILKGTLISIFLCLLIVLVGAYFWITRPQRLISAIEKKYDVRCEVTAIDYSFFGSLTADMSGLKVFPNSATFENTAILSCEKASCSVSGLFSGGAGLRIDQIELQHPVLHLTVNDEGQSNWEALRKKKKKKEKHSESKTDEKVETPSESNGLERFREISLTNGRIIYENHGKNSFAAISDITIKSASASDGTFNISGTLAASEHPDRAAPFASVPFHGTFSYPAEEHFESELTFAQNAHITREFPVIKKAWKFTDKIRSYGLSFRPLPERIDFRRERTLMLTLQGDLFILRSPLRIHSKEWEILLEPGATYHSVTSIHQAEFTVKAGEKLSRSLKKTLDRWIKKAPRPLRSSLEESVKTQLFQDESLAFGFTSSGPLTRPKVRSTVDLPDTKKLLKSSTKDLLKRLFD